MISISDEELKGYLFRLYPSTVKEIDDLVKKSRNFDSRADWIRTKIEYLITHDLVDEIPSNFDTDAVAKELMVHLGNRIQSHENRMYSRVATLEQVLGKIILKIESTDPGVAEVANYLDSISQQLYRDHLEETLAISLPAKLVKLLRYTWYGDYLADWIRQQQELMTLSYDGRMIRWNEERIMEVYRIE